MKKKVYNKNQTNLIKRKAFFFQRLGAYILDMFIVLLLASLLSTPFISSKTSDKLQKESNEVIENYMNKKIDSKTYMSQASDINYEISRQNGVYYFLIIAFSILYFVIFQFYNKGQTVGKKLMRIRIEKFDDSSLSMNDLIYRSLLINSIACDMLVFALTIFVTKDVYLYAITVIQSIKYLFIISCVIMIIYRKDGRGLHDLIANTIVVKNEEIIEEECKV